MNTLFNKNWQFYELQIDEKTMFKDGNPVLFNPDDFFEAANRCEYKDVDVPHDWQIYHVQDLYKNSAGCYRKNFSLTKEDITARHIALRFEGVYMNCAVWVNGKKAGEWKYGYSTFEFDITDLVKEGNNVVQVIAVYQHCNTRWYSGAGIFRDVWLVNTPLTFIAPDGIYINSKCTKPDSSLSELNGLWNCSITTELCGKLDGHTVVTVITGPDGKILAKSKTPLLPAPLSKEEENHLHKTVPSTASYSLSRVTETLEINKPQLWDTESPYLYTATVQLLDKTGDVIDSVSQNCGFKTAVFTNDKGFFLNGHHVKIYGACMHHDQGALGAAFNKNALRRQLLRLKEMGVNSVRTSHNPSPKAWFDLCDEMGIMVNNDGFDMWEKPKTQFDYGNYFNDWCERDTVSWVRKDRNHPCLIMWSIGNEIYDTHVGNGLQITKNLSAYVREHDPLHNAEITIASNYMMCDGAQECAKLIDTVGYNYLERLYPEQHEKYPEWKIYGSETSSTVQSRGIYHFPENLNLVTFNDGQCSCLGNCATPWSAKNTQDVITKDRDFEFSAGQYIWTGWDYIGEPTPYHTKNSYFGQIDTAGFPKDTFFLYKAEWANKNTAPFVHVLPYWDWNEGQVIDVKAYSNCEAIELFFNGKSLGKQEIDHAHGKEPFGRWQVVYSKGEIKAVGYDKDGKPAAEETKRSFEDPAKIILKPEPEDFGDLFFIDLMTCDKNGEPVENARNYITFEVSGEAELLGMDNGDSTDYDEYKPLDGRKLSRKLFNNRAVAIVRAKNKGAQFTVTAASKDLPPAALTWTGSKWTQPQKTVSIKPEKDFIPTRKIEIIAAGSTNMTKENSQFEVTCKVLPLNASIKEINWNPVLKECVSSDYIEVQNILGKGSGIEKAVIKAMSDGECILRCSARNGSNLDEVYSDLGFTVSGIGNAKLDPYTLIEACRHNDWDHKKEKSEISLESGISNRNAGPTWISFDKVDFGPDGADTIHIPIFTFETQVPVEIWDGKPGDGTTYEGAAPSLTGGECLGKFTYSHESIYNVYSENVFTLSKRLFGVHTISIVLPHELYFHGFYFDRTPKAFAKLRALDCNSVVGDSFTKTSDAIEGIGNNVTIDFADMDFGEKGASRLTVCGKSNTENNSINVKFFDKDGNSVTQVIEFAHTDGYEEKKFIMTPVKGLRKVSFVFLPGCNFDLKWFKFE